MLVAYTPILAPEWAVWSKHKGVNVLEPVVDSQRVIHTAPIVCMMGADIAAAKTSCDNGAERHECLVLADTGAI